MIRTPISFLHRACFWTIVGTIPLVAAEAEKKPGIRNDRIYPAEAAAAQRISCDGATFLIDGKRVFLASGTIHYPRVPRDLWRDRLLRLKRAGMNCVETYAFWNYHEPREGQIDFSGEKDLGEFLHIAQEVGLYAIVRVGPYVCAEWNAGGFPVWLRHKPGVVVRTDNAEFLRWNDHWYQSVMPIVAAHQIQRGGNVILVQLENEHPQGWGVVEGDPYFEHLYTTARKAGLEVPLVMSGLNHGGAPSPKIDHNPDQRQTPWFSTEFWAGWFDRYGVLDLKKQRDIESATWRIAAHGGGGYNYYMAHGGTNFAAWSDDSTSASYDFGAIIGQAGDLRPTFYRSKRINQFATAVVDAMAVARDASKDLGKDISGLSLAAARRGPAGTFLFLSGKEGTSAKQADGSTIRLAPSGLHPLVRDLVIDPQLTLATANLPLLGLARAAGALTVIVYGYPGEQATISLRGPDLAQPTLSVAVPRSGSAGSEIRQGERTIRLLAVTRDASLRTWILGEPGAQVVVVGPAMVHAVSGGTGLPTVTYERPLNEPAPGRIDVISGTASWHLAATAATAAALAAPRLGPWTMAPCREIASDADTAGWISANSPPALGADDVDSLYGWYRTTVELPAAGSATLALKGRDRTRVFVNGTLHKGGTLNLPAGRNTIAALVAIDGRNKAFNRLVPWDTFDVKGLEAGPDALRVAGSAVALGPWLHHGGVDPSTVTAWNPIQPSGGRPSLYRTSFTATPPGAQGVQAVLRVDTRRLSRGSVWLNGRDLGHYPEKIPVNGLYMPPCWLKDGANDLVVFDEDGADPANLSLYVETAASREVLTTGGSVAEDIPMAVPAENPPRDLNALNRGNFAYKAEATSDGSDKGSVPGYASDGDADTRWSAADRTPGHWLAVDLGEARTIGTCEIWWNLPSRMFRFHVEGSLDGSTWTRIGDQGTAVPTSPDSPSEVSRLILPGIKARHLRITGDADSAKLVIGDLRVLAP